MPELILEIGGRVYEVACEAGEEKSLEHAAGLFDAEAQQVVAIGGMTEKRTLLLAGLMLADRLAGMQRQLDEAAEHLRAAEDRVRITEAKAAMLASNAMRSESVARHLSDDEIEQLIAENDVAVGLLSKVLEDINALADEVEAEARAG
ncbi:MAG: cell division protein ZapA [Rhodobacteraceae bacterium]|uniref:cell division protein ZapA n=1 Tax=Amaricoccus sp. B4 TaxID=3368557 RepID=UPI000DAB7A11|nr:cell division protein ZapA [Paracoccaceae bacterium]